MTSRLFKSGLSVDFTVRDSLKIAKTLVAGPSFCHRIAGMTLDAI